MSNGLPRQIEDILHRQSTFTRADLARIERRDRLPPGSLGPDLSGIVSLGTDSQGRERFTGHDMLAIERGMADAAATLHSRRRHVIGARAADRAAAGGGLQLGDQQKAALRHVLCGPDLSLVVGHAGTGKSAMLAAAQTAWRGAGYGIKGGALSGIAAEGLEQGSGIESRTLAAWETLWTRRRDLLTARDVLVIDEAGMIGSRQMARLLTAAAKARAKVVLVGDFEQLQGIEAGAAFRALVDRHGAAAIHDIRRQLIDWQRAATRELATGATGAAIDRYAGAGMVHQNPTREEARLSLVAAWDAARRNGGSQIMLAHARVDVLALNLLARACRRAAGELGRDISIDTAQGPRSFAAGDAVMFLRNDRALKVKNGTVGTIERIGGGRLEIAAAGRAVSVDPAAYRDLAHGYAATVHKAQGVTVDRAFLLASPAFDRHLAYVGLSRHRESVCLHWAVEDFRDAAQLKAVLARPGGKDTTLDYLPCPAPAPGLLATAWRAAVTAASSLFGRALRPVAIFRNGGPL